MDEIKNERQILLKLKHENIAAMKSAWADSTYYYILLDYALNGDLLGFLKRNRKSKYPIFNTLNSFKKI